jgi:hypothetical protein
MKRYGTVSYLIVVRVTPAPLPRPQLCQSCPVEGRLHPNSVRVGPLKAAYTPTLPELGGGFPESGHPARAFRAKSTSAGVV